MAIYQKYRPQTFNEVKGHDYVKKILLNSLRNGRISHAYLFTGPRGTGKTTMARLIAKAVNCLDPKNGDACGKCEVCMGVQNGKFIDLIEIDAASNRGIDEIRLLKEKVNFAPLTAKKKVYIIDEVHMLTREAFNALLKTLEEPPEFVIFIMATTEPHKVPATILSRVQRFDLKLGTQGEVVDTLKSITKAEGVELAEDAAIRIYELGGGSFRDSESILDKVLSIEVKKDHKISLAEVEEILGIVEGKVVGDFLDLIIKGDTALLLENLESTINSGVSIDQFINQLIIETRKRIRAVYADKQGKDLRKLIEIAGVLSEASYKMKEAIVPSLPLEIAILKLTVGAVADKVGKLDSANERKIEKIEKENSDVNEMPVSGVKPVSKAKVERNVVKESVEGSIKDSFKEDVKKLPEKAVEEVVKEEHLKVEETNTASVHNANSTLTVEEVKNNWQQIIKESKEFNHNLCAFLASANVKSLQDDTLTLEVAYKFHKQKIESMKAREFLKDLFKKLFNADISVFCEVNPDLVKSAIEENIDNLSNENIVEEIFQDV